jgi:hypothetical protein
MKRSLYLFPILLFLGIFAVHFTVYMAHADDATTVKSSKSNSDKHQIQPGTEPAEVNPCANTRCQSGYHCLPLSQVGFCAKDQAAMCTVTCYGISGDMHGSCADYAHQLAIHPKYTFTNL